MAPESARIRLARLLCGCALFLLFACIIATPWGLRPFAACMLLSILLAPDLLWSRRRDVRASLRVLLLPMLLVTLAALLSGYGTGIAWQEVDNRARTLLVPLIALAVFALRPNRAWAWSGAVTGLAAVCALLLFEKFRGALRPSGWTNAIVFAQVTLGLMIVARFCKPPGKEMVTLLSLLLGTTAILLTGSRGVWPALLVVLVFALRVRDWRLRFTPRTWVLLACALALVAWATTASVLVRVDALQHDIAGYGSGHADTSLGARLDLFGVALEAFRAHPWTGVGVGNFGAYLQASPDCIGSATATCGLGHAHSDVPEWAATMGIPGLLAILLLYGVPIVFFARRVHRGGWPASGVSLAGLLFVVTFAMNGLTQSMFAHQLTASFFALAIGLLAGLCMAERRPR